MESNLEALENEFYVLLMRIFVIQCARRAQQQEDGNRIGPRKILTSSRQSWQIFLDCLCTLCDVESGGATTTAIGVEQIDSKSIFWIATNEVPTTSKQSAISKPQSHSVRNFLTCTLRRLARLKTASTLSSTVQSEIFRDSIKFCKKRIAHYRRYTLKSVASIKEGAYSTTNLKQLIEQISELLLENKDDCTVCKDAYDFCRSNAGILLRSEVSRTSTAWRYLRHNIGRLAHWYKAVKYLVNAAPDFADVLLDFIVDIVPGSYDPTKRVRFLDSLTDLFPKTELEEYDFSLDRMRTVFGVSAMEEAEISLDAFLDSPRQLKLHAEVRVADFFYISGRSYFQNVRYVGCSKGSCYCCDLYFSVHPGNLIRRPCHENAWVKWQLSSVMLMQVAGAPLLERMVFRMRDDINRVVMHNGHRGHARTFDSSTGIASFE